MIDLQAYATELLGIDSETPSQQIAKLEEFAHYTADGERIMQRERDVAEHRCRVCQHVHVCPWDADIGYCLHPDNVGWCLPEKQECWAWEESEDW